ncbi:MAG: glycoside hydrolase family 95 protein [Luteolibacter sp.]
MRERYKRRFMATVCSSVLVAGAAFSEDETGDYRRGMTLVTPAEGWREALPSGNGKIGALVYGSISSERVLFNHNELWYGGKIPVLPDLSAELPVVRGLLDEGKYLEANGHYPSKMKAAGFDGKNAVYHPAFDMLVSTETELMFEDYSRTLDFESGEAKVKWRDGDTHFTRSLFVSIPDDVSVMSIRADKAGSVSGAVTLDIHDLMDALAQNGSTMDPGFTYQTTASDGFVEFRADGSDGGEFGGVVRVYVDGGESALEGESISFSSADEVTLVVGFYANEPGDVAVPRLKKQLGELGGDYDALLTKHDALHRERFNSMGLTLNTGGKRDTPNEVLLLEAYQGKPSNELLEKLFDYGRYLLISSSRAGGYPANLQGIWNGDYAPPWSSLYGNNENLQMSYWQGLPGNLEESMMAFYDYFDAHLDEFRTNAKQLYGCRGIFIPPFMSPDSGIMRHTAPHVVYWTDAAGWLATFYNDYYLFTGDREFLEKRAIPFMEEVALFYEDFIVKDAEGKNMFYPSQSPENEPADKVVIDPKTGRKTHIKVQINSTITVAIAKEVLTNLIRSCELLDIKPDDVARWKALLADMPEYEINEDGALKEWLHPDFKDNYEHRHQSHIYPLFPGFEIREETEPELYKAARVAIEKRLRIGLKSQTGWSLAHMANVWARLGESEKAMETLGILARVSVGKNFFTYHNDWRKMGVTMDFGWGRTAPFQMDANFGIPAAIIEMLCGSEADMLRLFPALPEEWAQGEFHDMLTRAGVRISAKWDMAAKKIELDLVAERDTEFDIKFPGELSKLECSEADRLGESGHGPSYRSLKMKKGDKLHISAVLR